MNALARRLIPIMAVVAAFFASPPALAFDLISTPTFFTDQTSTPDSNFVAKFYGSVLAALDKTGISPIVTRIAIEPRTVSLLAQDQDLRRSTYAKVIPGISVALADENSVLIVKRITVRGIGLQQTWPRRPPTALEVPTDHIFEVGFGFKF